MRLSAQQHAEELWKMTPEASHALCGIRGSQRSQGLSKPTRGTGIQTQIFPTSSVSLCCFTRESQHRSKGPWESARLRISVLKHTELFTEVSTQMGARLPTRG